MFYVSTIISRSLLTLFCCFITLTAILPGYAAADSKAQVLDTFKAMTITERKYSVNPIPFRMSSPSPSS